MLQMSRNVILEREFYYQMKLNTQFIASVESNNMMNDYLEKNKSKNLSMDVVSPFLVTRNIKNRSTLVLHKVMIKKGQ